MDAQGIDFVVLWVDGSDPAWAAEKAKYAPKDPLSDSADNRYRDWGLMRYWFRSVETFAPWVNMVHFVTWGHVPDFLNRNALKLHIVRHEEFMPERYLPTFSSCSIEANIHRIPGLAERFVYFNDDIFLLRPVAPDRFFRNGLPCTYGAEVPLQSALPDNPWRHHLANDMGLIERNFSKREQVRKNRAKYVSLRYGWRENLRTLALETLYPGQFLGFKGTHGPTPFLKSVFQEVWEKEPEALDFSCRNKFRNYGQVNQNLFQWWQIAGGMMEPIGTDGRVEAISTGSIERICAFIRQQQDQWICLQDNVVAPLGVEKDFEMLTERLGAAFDSILPHPSQFEIQA